MILYKDLNFKTIEKRKYTYIYVQHINMLILDVGQYICLVSVLLCIILTYNLY